MSRTAQVADHLDDRTDDVIAAWRAASLRNGDVPRSTSLTYAEFVDHIPLLLDRMADRLRGRPADVADAAEKHGHLRWRQGYDVAEVVAELGLLRGALVQATFAYARDRDFDLPMVEAALAAIDEVLNEAAAESVRQFQEDSRAQAEAHLAEVEARRRAVEEARITAEAERAKLRTLLGNLPVGVWVVAADGQVVAINHRGEELQGFPADQVVGHINIRRHASAYHLSRPDGADYGPDEIPLARALRGEVVAQEEVVWHQPGGDRIVTVSAAPLTDRSGAIVGAMAVVQDITPRKRVEEALRESEDRLRLAVEATALGTWDYRPITGELRWSDRCKEIFGLPPEAAINYDVFLARLHPDDRERTDRAVQQALDPDGGGEYDIEYRALWPDGTVRWVNARGHAFFEGVGPSRRPVRFIGTALDVTARKRLGSDLADASAQLNAIVEKSPVLIWRAGPDGRCNFFNQTWLDFRGRTLQQELGDDWVEGVHPDDRSRFLDTYRDAVASRAPFEVTYRLLRRDGQYRWISDRGTPYFDGEGRFLGYLGSCLDITERIELETSLKQQRELAEESSRHKTRLMSALSHDARTPLNAVFLSAQLLEMHVQGQADPEVQECLRTIRHSVRNVLDLLGDVLNLTKIDAGADPPEVTRFELEPVLVECLASVEAQARQKGLDCRLDPGPLAGAVVQSDRAKLKQILSNLLSNALRFTERGHIRLKATRATGQVLIAVEDTGVGIAPADQQRIFDEFARLDHPDRPAGDGTGLGLAICRRLASLLRGEILLESAPGRGSTFTLALPDSVLTSARPDGDPASAATAPAEVPGSGTILVVDDHLTGRQVLGRLLQRMGYRVVEAGNGRDALALARRERPLAVLMDVNMPVMDGIDATLAFRADPALRDVPIFALTGDVSLVSRQRIGDAGVNGYLEKPVTPESLKSVLSRLAARPG
jgi:PAS domain S-box-containing protein